MMKLLIIGFTVIVLAFIGCSGETATPAGEATGGEAVDANSLAVNPEVTPPLNPESTANVSPESTAEVDAAEIGTEEAATDEIGADLNGWMVAASNSAQDETEEAEAPAQDETEEAEASTEADAEAPSGDAQTPEQICEAALPAEEPETREFEAAEEVLQPETDYRAVFCTEAGAVYVDLFEEQAPTTVNNFVFLAQNDFYNNTTFHRVLEDFMAQGGDPTGTGGGGPGYQFEDEFSYFLTFDRPGLLAMANANRPEQGIVGTNGSQFFITTTPTQYLDYRHTIFGQVLTGQQNVLNLQLRDPQNPADAEITGSALETVVIITDPEAVTVEGSDVVPVEAVSGETVRANLQQISQSLEGSGLVFNLSELQTEVEGAPENLEYRLTSSIENEACDLESFPFISLGYTLDAYASAEAAEAAVTTLTETAADEGLTAGDLDVFGEPVYAGTTDACEVEATRGRVYIQGGQYVAVLEAVAQPGLPVDIDAVLEQIVLPVFKNPVQIDYVQ